MPHWERIDVIPRREQVVVEFSHASLAHLLREMADRVDQLGDDHGCDVGDFEYDNADGVYRAVLVITNWRDDVFGG